VKLKGVKLDKPKEVLAVIPRDGVDLVFKFQAIIHDDEFDKLCVEPKVPQKRLKDKTVPDHENPVYLAELKRYATQSCELDVFNIY
jgi:hypothetical protein